MSARPCLPDLATSFGDVVVRPFGSNDIESIRRACADPITQQWLPLPNPYTIRDATEWCTRVVPAERISGAGLTRAIEHEGRLVGSISLTRLDWTYRTAEIGYWAVPAARGKGLTSRAIAGLAQWALQDQQFERIELRAATGNVASQRVAEKAGFVREGVARSAGTVHHGRVDLVVYSLIRSDIRSEPSIQR